MTVPQDCEEVVVVGDQHSSLMRLLAVGAADVAALTAATTIAAALGAGPDTGAAAALPLPSDGSVPAWALRA